MLSTSNFLKNLSVPLIFEIEYYVSWKVNNCDICFVKNSHFLLFFLKVKSDYLRSKLNKFLCCIFLFRQNGETWREKGQKCHQRGGDTWIHSQPPQTITRHWLQIPCTKSDQRNQKIRWKTNGNSRCSNWYPIEQTALVQRNQVNNNFNFFLECLNFWNFYFLV